MHTVEADVHVYKPKINTPKHMRSKNICTLSKPLFFYYWKHYLNAQPQHC